MKCVICEACGKRMDHANNIKLCVPVRVGTFDGASQFCWCLCDKCRNEFMKRSNRVLQEHSDI